MIQGPRKTSSAELREARNAVGVSLQVVADELGSWPTRISELERGLKYDDEFAERYEQWLQAKTAA